MIVLGITGGIGAGKSQVLDILKNKHNAYIVEADKVAHNLMMPGKKAYNEIVESFGTDILMSGSDNETETNEVETNTIKTNTIKTNTVKSNTIKTKNFKISDKKIISEKDSLMIDRTKMGKLVMSNPDKLELLNSIVHPIVKDWIINDIEEHKNIGTKLYVIEAALLIQCGYKEICDEIWYISASSEVRLSRLMEFRGLTEERALSFMKSQPSDDFFVAGSDRVIDNSHDISSLTKQVEKTLSECYNFYV